MNREFSDGNREFDLQRHFPPWALLSIPQLTRAPELSRYRGQAGAACRRGDQHCEASRGRKHLQQRRRPRSDRYRGGHIRSQGSEALRRPIAAMRLAPWPASESAASWQRSVTATEPCATNTPKAKFTLITGSHSDRRQCPSRVKSAGLNVGQSLPVYPDQRTFAGCVGMSQRCQERKHSRKYTVPDDGERAHGLQSTDRSEGCRCIRGAN
jgi:hypothetical protein